jgi:6-phosphofructokinase 1
MVDIYSTRYAIARRYMIRIRRDDFDDPHELAKFAATAGMSLEEFRGEFEYLIADEPPPLQLLRPGRRGAEEAAAKAAAARAAAEQAAAVPAAGTPGEEKRDAAGSIAGGRRRRR